MQKKVLPFIVTLMLAVTIYSMPVVAAENTEPVESEQQSEDEDQNEAEQQPENEAAEDDPQDNIESEKQQLQLEANFVDVNDAYWAKSEIHYLYSLAIVSGYEPEPGKYEFKPENNVTRAQAAKMLVSALGEEELKVAKPSFTDVPTDDWAFGWIEQAVNLNIFTGYDDGTFKPNAQLTRAQMSKMITNAFALSMSAQSEDVLVFTDVKKDHWALPFINRMYYNGITTGSNNRYMPENKITRAQFSAFLSRALSEEFKIPVVIEPINGTVIYKGTVTAQSNLNVRSGPTTESIILGKLPAGEEIDIYAINGNWVKFNFNGQSGYVYKTYVKLKNLSGSPIKDRIIVLDAGHGGTDPGAVEGTNNEKNIVIKIATLLEQKLNEGGAKVVMTRSNDSFPSLAERVDISKKNYAEMFVSIHVNSYTTGIPNGTETYYDTSTNDNGPESMILANEIQQRLIANTGMNDRGIKDNGFYVIKNNNVPSVLVELGFLSNDADREKLIADQYVEIFAQSIYDGIVQYYQK